MVNLRDDDASMNGDITISTESSNAYGSHGFHFRNQLSDCEPDTSDDFIMNTATNYHVSSLDMAHKKVDLSHVFAKDVSAVVSSEYKNNGNGTLLLMRDNSSIDVSILGNDVSNEIMVDLPYKVQGQNLRGTASFKDFPYITGNTVQSHPILSVVKHLIVILIGDGGDYQCQNWSPHNGKAALEGQPGGGGLICWKSPQLDPNIKYEYFISKTLYPDDWIKSKITFNIRNTDDETIIGSCHTFAGQTPLTTTTDPNPGGTNGFANGESLINLNGVTGKGGAENWNYDGWAETFRKQRKAQGLNYNTIATYINGFSNTTVGRGSGCNPADGQKVHYSDGGCRIYFQI